MKATQFVSRLTLVILLFANATWARADCPEAVESRLRAQLARILSSSDRETSFRACLLTEDEALIEVRVTAGAGGELTSDSEAVQRVRSQVVAILGAQFPDVSLSELSSFRLAPRPPPLLFALKSEK